MDKHPSLLLWLFIVILGDLKQFGQCFFDVDEINSVNYGIDILDVPVMLGQEHDGGSVFLASRYGQQYQCTYQEKSHEEELREKEDEKVAMEMGIVELLKPMENGPCLINTKGWWTYEFCFGKFIRQFHLEDSKITGTIMYLGHYHSDYDWSNTTQLRKQRSWLSRYHTQQYVNGTSCDLTSKSRRTEVRFYCEQTQSDYISRVDETETCVYTISVQTARICNHPYLKPPAPTKAIPITCNPVLSEKEYGRYLDMIAAREEQKLMKQRIIESQKQLAGSDIEGMIRPSDEKLADDDSDMDDTDTWYDVDTPAAADADTDEDGNDLETGQMGAMQKILSQTLMKELKEVLGEENEQNIKISKMTVKKIKSGDDINDAIKDVLRSNKKSSTASQITNGEAEGQGQTSLDGEGDGEDTFSQGQGQLSLDEENDGEDIFSQVHSPRTLPEDEEDTEKVLTSRKSATGKFEDDEVDKQEDEDEEVDKEALLEFDKGLDDIIETEGHLKQIKDYKDTLQQEINAQFDDILQEAEAELDMDLDEVQNIDTDQALKTMSDTLQKLMKQLQQKTMKKSSSGSVAPMETDHVETETDVEEQDAGRAAAASKSDKDAATEDEDDDKDAQLMNMEYDLNYGEHKIQVKIFTSSDYYEEAAADMLQGGNAINKMIVAVLGGNSDEVKEAQRQEKMETGYSFVWDSPAESDGSKDKNSDRHLTDNS